MRKITVLLLIFTLSLPLFETLAQSRSVSLEWVQNHTLAIQKGGEIVGFRLYWAHFEEREEIENYIALQANVIGESWGANTLRYRDRVESNEWTDGEFYCFQLANIMSLGGGFFESERSPMICHKMRSDYPPGAPTLFISFM